MPPADIARTTIGATASHTARPTAPAPVTPPPWTSTRVPAAAHTHRHPTRRPPACCGPSSARSTPSARTTAALRPSLDLHPPPPPRVHHRRIPVSPPRRYPSSPPLTLLLAQPSMLETPTHEHTNINTRADDPEPFSPLTNFPQLSHMQYLPAMPLEGTLCSADSRDSGGNLIRLLNKQLPLQGDARLQLCTARMLEVVRHAQPGQYDRTVLRRMAGHVGLKARYRLQRELEGIG